VVFHSVQYISIGYMLHQELSAGLLAFEEYCANWLASDKEESSGKRQGVRGGSTFILELLKHGPVVEC